MKKQGLWLVSMLALRVMGASISQEVALEQAVNWMKSNPVMKSASDSVSSVTAFPAGDATYSVYVVSLSPTGFLILNSDDDLPLVLSFSRDSGVDLTDLPGNAFRSMLLDYVAEIDALYQNVTPNTAPSVQDATFSIAEDAVVGATVGTVAASDPENDTLAFSVTSSTFAIDAVSGEITVTGALDYETTTSYSLTVTVSDGALSDTATITINITDVTDEDADGLDDAWEITHFGNRAQNGSGDPDQDGYSNLQEAICGTHPDDSSSRWLLENGEGNLPSFYGATGRKYTIRYSTNLVSQTWLTLVSDVSGANGMIQVKDYDSSTNGFRAYRVEVEME